MTAPCEIEPFQQFAEFMSRYAKAERIIGFDFNSWQMAEIERVAREFGIRYHDGIMELIRQ